MERVGSRLLERALYAAVLCSGAAALVYQLAWTRRLASVTSATTTAQALVLAVVMAGLGLGAWAAGRRARALRAPGTVYAMVELVAALLACLSIPLIGASDVVRSAVALLGADPRTGLGVQLAVLLACLALPATALGASLPLVVEALERGAPRRDPARAAARIAILYGVNTLGAVLGCGLAGFAFVETFGLWRTTWWGAGLAVVAAAIAWAATRAGPTTREDTHRGAPRPSAPSPVASLVVAAVAGFVGLGAEVVWTRMVSLVVPNTTFVVTQVLGCVLLGIALGAGALVPALRAARRAADPLAALRGLIALVCGVGAVALCAVPMALARLAEAPALHDAIAAGNSPLGVLLLALVLVPGAAAVSAVFPATVALERSRRGGAESFGDLYAANTAGCVAGSSAAAFALLPALGSAGATQTFAMALAGVAWWALSPHPPRYRAALGAAAAGALALVVAADVPRSVYRARLAPGERILEFREGRDSGVMVTETAEGRRRIWINSVWVAGTGGGHRGLGHLPALFVAEPRAALGIALGTGQTFASARRHGFASLDCVEIDGGVIALSKRWFADATDRLFERPGVTLHRDDGRAFLRATRERYDLIVLEPLQAWTVGTSNLYSVEFYREALAALAEGGVVAQWVPLYGQGVTETRALVRAALEVFPEASLWLDDRDGILILKREPFVLQPERMGARIAGRGIGDDLARSALDAPEDWLSLFVMGPRGLAAWSADAPLLADDRPFLEFAAGRDVGRDQSREILTAVRAGLELPEDYLDPDGAGRVAAESAVAIRAALIDERLLPRDDAAALAERLEAGLAAAPSSLLRRRYRNLMLGWARGLQQAGDGIRAEAVYRRTLDHAPELGEAAVNLALLLARQARTEEARRALERPFAEGPVADSARRVLAELKGR